VIQKPTPRRKERRVVSTATRESVYLRDGYICQWCRTPGGRLDAPHHRLLRSRGGSDKPGNLVTVHRICHDYIHAHPVEARARGFLLRATDEPGTVDVGGWAPEVDTPSGATAESIED
jgi:5-methylcytosine-specific restriction endonuclease McrA